ncbi:uncharacterized protein GIQ15_02738 [Arthroderma uncinatum]|uniref:uncharacterized protein n=1 Tax=Arthroderma uncinatum TaxID=74035 RepID=UPI00144A917C|nr:uncharacterized protein GIQ15_02738 [Arthroderma uncinatum]KAF3483414.1 hypothetical protein GIQ15_02738 [Arthroderma uncinatum]
MGLNNRSTTERQLFDPEYYSKRKRHFLQRTRENNRNAQRRCRQNKKEAQEKKDKEFQEMKEELGRYKWAFWALDEKVNDAIFHSLLGNNTDEIIPTLALSASALECVVEQQENEGN